MSSEASYAFPAFDKLAKVEGRPQGCLWGFYDKDGQKDEIGGKGQFHRAEISMLLLLTRF